MDGLVGVLVLVGLAVLAMPVLLIVALVSLAGLKQRVAALEQALAARAPAMRQDESARPSAFRAAAPAARAAPEETDERTLAERMRDQAGSGPTPAAGVPTPKAASPTTDAPGTPVTPPEMSPAAGPAVPRPQPVPAPPPGPASPAGAVPPPLPAAARVPRGEAPSAVSPAPRLPRREAPAADNPVLRMVKRWFTVGNVPVKIGVLVLLAGVAALLKYASDQGLFVLPMELRLAGVAAAALGALAFAWRRRDSNRSFALSLQGGAIGVLLLVVFAAFKLYGMIDPGPAFALSVMLVAGMGLLAVLQDAKALAVFALLAGFLAPIWLSTGQGNHVALFSYYALLNAAIVAIAWFKAWRILNLLGFAFTFGIGTVWGMGAYLPGKYASTQPFLALFFLFYLAVPILFARRRPEGRRDLVDGCLVFGTPLVAFALQAGLLQGVMAGGSRLPLAFCALGLGVLYAGLAWALLRRAGYTVLGQSYAILAVGFATLAVPLALSARATASVFALEGAGLVWLGLRQGRWLPRFTGALLQLLAAVALLAGLDAAAADARALFNPTAMGMLLIALAGLASAWAARAHDQDALALPFYLWGLAWWTGLCVHEVQRFVEAAVRPDALLVLAALSGWIAAEIHRRRPAPALAFTVFAAFLAAAPLALWQDAVHAHPFGGGYGALAWVAFAALGLRSLGCLRGDDDGGAGAAQFVWWLLWPCVLSMEGHWLAADAGLGQGWQVALVMLPWLALAALGLWRWSWLAFPREEERAARLRVPVLWLAFAVLAAAWLAALTRPLPPAPLAWLPWLNPGELAQLLALALGVAWLGSEHAPAGLQRARIGVLALGGFLLLSATTLRGVHYWGGIGWNAGLLSSSLAQTSLTVVWSVLGVLGWIIGSRRGRRGLWLAGAVLMAVVLAKLVLVDRSHLGNLTGIVSFMAYGVLCTIVGYLAPAPPRLAAVEEAQA